MRKYINLVEMEIDQESETPEEDAAYERQLKLEKAVKKFCETQIGWTFDDHSYALTYDADENEIMITPDNEEVTVAELDKLRAFGSAITISSSSKPYALTIKVKVNPDIASRVQLSNQRSI